MLIDAKNVIWTVIASLHKYKCTIYQELTSHALRGLSGSWRTLLHMADAKWRRGRNLERMTSYQKSDSLSRFIFIRTILQNIIPIRFEMS